ncbi:MAG: serine/threonine protein kinase with repeat [Myxococcales bacterium]|nr:serine/threonine protein kinase with repeat [Myxococcales bacterium]
MAESGGFPRRFDQYVLLKPLARGGMGELYLALAGARGMEKPCVIKTVLPSLITGDSAQRFRDEAMVVVRLQHGNLVSVFDAGRNGDQVYIVMEYVDGKDLLAVWNRCAGKRVPFPIDVAAYIVKELARGLGYAHAFGGLQLVHRDVSPANVLLSYTGEVKLTDFGLARSTLKLQQTAPGIIYGKLSYLSPEQARSETLDGRSDLYAAGILLWELLTGQQLFPVKTPAAGDNPGARRDSTADALARLRDPQIVLPSHVTPRVPPELDAIAMRALAPDPALRYQTGEELRADLATFLAATAPHTDAARLSSFLRPLFHDIAEAERRERETLLRAGAGLLSGAFSAELSAASLAPRPLDSIDEPSAAHKSRRRSGDQQAREGRRRFDRDERRAVADTGEGDARTRPARPGEDPRVGMTLGGRYHIERLCGEGAMGRVYEARHVDIGRRLAVKVLHSTYLSSPELVERFRREARAASKVGHPNIVDVTDSGTTSDGAFYFVMEFLDGVDLEQLIARDGRLPVERALRIAGQIARAVQAAHAGEIIHRDLKPANVMLVSRKDEEDFVKVLDFGISRNMDLEQSGEGHKRGLTRPDVAVGTPVYMSPEQAAGVRADALTDVYAVGGLLYEMLTATPPCEGDDVLTVLNKKATQDPQPVGKLRPELPADVQALVMRALSRSPKDRQPTMTALKDEILACLVASHGAPLPAPGAGRLTPAPMALESEGARGNTERTVVFRARPWMLGVGAGALVAILAAGWYVRRSDVTADEPTAATPTTTTTTTGESPAAAPPPREPAAPAIVIDQIAPPLPPQEPVALKRVARLVEHTPTAAPPAPSLAAPWPAASPLVFAQTPRTTGTTKRAALEHAATPGDASATSAPAGAAAPTSDEILARGQSAFDRGNYPEAIRRAKEAMALGAAVPGHLLVADAYYHLQRYADALREYQATLALEPSNALARRGRELAERAATAESGK